MKRRQRQSPQTKLQKLFWNLRSFVKAKMRIGTNTNLSEKFRAGDRERGRDRAI